MLEAGESFTEVMLGLSYYIEECVNYNITTKFSYLRNWVIDSKVKSGVIQHLNGSLNARFEYFNEVTKSTKELCHFCITLNDTDVLEKMNKQSGGDDSFFSRFKKSAEKTTDGLSGILNVSKSKIYEKIPTTETLQDFTNNATEKAADFAKKAKAKAKVIATETKAKATDFATETKAKATDFATETKAKATDFATETKAKATTLMDTFIQGFKEFINNLSIKYQELRSKWQEYREKDVLFQSFKSGIIETKDNVKENIKETRQKFQNFMNNDDQLILADLITKTILNAQFNKSYKQLNEAIDNSDAGNFKRIKEEFNNVFKKDFKRIKEEFKTNLKKPEYNYNDEPTLDPSQDMKKEIDKIKNEKENIFTKIYDSFFPGQKQLSKKKKCVCQRRSQHTPQKKTPPKVPSGSFLQAKTKTAQTQVNIT